MITELLSSLKTLAVNMDGLGSTLQAQNNAKPL